MKNRKGGGLGGGQFVAYTWAQLVSGGGLGGGSAVPSSTYLSVLVSGGGLGGGASTSWTAYFGGGLGGGNLTGITVPVMLTFASFGGGQGGGSAYSVPGSPAVQIASGGGGLGGGSATAVLPPTLMFVTAGGGLGGGTGVGSSPDAAVGTASATSSADATGRTAILVVGSAAGTSSASGVSTRPKFGAFTASATSSATGVGGYGPGIHYGTFTASATSSATANTNNDVVSPCCPGAPIPQSLTLAITNISGCPCMAGSYAFTYQFATSDWRGTYTVCTGKTMTARVFCQTGGTSCTSMLLTLICGGTVICNAQLPTSCQCHPYQGTWTNLSVSGSCCTGFVNLTVS